MRGLPYAVVVIPGALLVVATGSGTAAAQPGRGSAGVCSELAVTAGLANVAGRSEERLLGACFGHTLPQFSLRPLAWRRVFRDSVAALHERENQPAPRVEIGPLWSSAVFNSTRATEIERGPSWAGRGFSWAGTMSLNAWWGWLSWSLQPSASIAQNRSFAPSRAYGGLGFQSPWYVGSIDMPYRFGDETYRRLDPGDSFIRIDAGPMGFGVSTESQAWGPARMHPLVLRGSARGFPHVFLESAAPVRTIIGDISGRWILGRLETSPWAPDGAAGEQRMAVAVAGVFVPRAFRQLELGATRFFSVYQSDDAGWLDAATLPFSGFLKVSSFSATESNQLASVFARLAPQEAPVEVYAEFMREDHSWNLRDLIGEPDHSSAVLLGLSYHRVDTMASAVTVVTLEHVNARRTHLSLIRPQLPLYTHHAIREGHTHAGRSLGSAAVPGGGGFSLVVDRRRSSTGWTFLAEVERVIQDPGDGAWEVNNGGTLTLGLAGSARVRDNWWTVGARLQPGFGDVPGTNVQLSASVQAPPRILARSRKLSGQH